MLFDSYDTQYKSPFGAVAENTAIHFTIHAESELDIRSASIVIRDSENISTTYHMREIPAQKPLHTTFSLSLTLKKTGLYHYRFELFSKNDVYFVGTVDGHTAEIGDWLDEWRLTIYKPDFITPTSQPGSIIYQIFPDRFNRGQNTPITPLNRGHIYHENWDAEPLADHNQGKDYFMGTLEGIRKKLDYLSELEVNIIYLNPIFRSSENHRYSTGDYLQIDPYLGNNEQFKELCQEAAKRGMRIILDGVFSHTGADSLYFNRYGNYNSEGAYNSKSSPYYNWYSFSEFPDTYDCWWGFKTLPNVNETEPSYLEFITGEGGVLEYWQRLGAGGWRLDVADELPDRFLCALRARVKAVDPSALIIGEVWENAVTKVSYGNRRTFLLGDQCDSVMNYPWREAILRLILKRDAIGFYEAVMEILNDYPLPAQHNLMNILSTHDTPRIINCLSGAVEKTNRHTPLSEREYEKGKALLAIAAAVQFTLPGIPCIYYGDEAGLQGEEDPFSRRTFPWGHEDRQIAALYKTLAGIRKKYKEHFARPMVFCRALREVVEYRRGNIRILCNMSAGKIKIPEHSTVLFSNGAQDDTVLNRHSICIFI